MRCDCPVWSLFSHLLPSLIKSGSSWWSPQWPWLCVTSEAKRWAEEEINFKHFPQLASHWWITVSNASDWSMLITWPEYWPLIDRNSLIFPSCHSLTWTADSSSFCSFYPDSQEKDRLTDSSQISLRASVPVGFWRPLSHFSLVKYRRQTLTPQSTNAQTAPVFFLQYYKRLYLSLKLQYTSHLINIH